MAPLPNTQSREVNLTKPVQAPEGMRYCPIVLASNGRIRPDLVLINGRPELHRGIAKMIKLIRPGQCVIEMFQQLTSRTSYSEVIPILFSHVSTNGGHPVIGIFVRRMPNPWPP